jgi:hypothetical protein
VGEMSTSGSVVLLYSTTEPLRLRVTGTLQSERLDKSLPCCLERSIPATCCTDTRWSRRPGRLVLSDLVPGAAYELSWHIENSDLSSRDASMHQTGGLSDAVFTHRLQMLTNAEGAPQPRVVTISCDRPRLRYNTNLWADVHARDLRPGDVCICMGDQVYADEIGVAFILGWKRRNLLTPRSLPANVAATANDRASRRLYSKLADMYCENWMRPATRQVLASAATLMFKDDHEVIDDKLQTKYATHPAFIVYQEVALRVYRDFQLALRLGHAPDAEATPSAGALYTWPIARGTAVHLVDCSYHGFDDAAAESVQRFLQTPGLLRAIVACGCLPLPSIPKPPVSMSRFVFGDRARPGDIGSWSKGAATALCEAMLNFRLQPGVARGAAIVGGDWHASLTGTIVRSRSSRSSSSVSEETVRGVPFMCSSGISNVCTPVDVTGNIDPIRELAGPNELMAGMTVTCDAPTVTCARNYGVVYPEPEGVSLCNKFASDNALEPATLTTVTTHCFELARAAFWGLVAR